MFSDPYDQYDQYHIPGQPQQPSQDIYQNPVIQQQMQEQMLRQFYLE